MRHSLAKYLTIGIDFFSFSFFFFTFCVKILIRYELLNPIKNYV